jgi:hypothetical protein
MTDKHVFISYAREDAEHAERIFRDLEREGFRPWLDRHSLLPGEKWQYVVGNAIADASHCIVLLSANSVSKVGYVHKEVRIALEVLDTHPESSIFVIPVRLEPCVPDHPKLRALNWIDLFESYLDGFVRLCRALDPGGSTLVQAADGLILDGPLPGRLPIAQISITDRGDEVARFRPSSEIEGEEVTFHLFPTTRTADVQSLFGGTESVGNLFSSVFGHPGLIADTDRLLRLYAGNDVVSTEVSYTDGNTFTYQAPYTQLAYYIGTQAAQGRYLTTRYNVAEPYDFRQLPEQHHEVMLLCDRALSMIRSKLGEAAFIDRYRNGSIVSVGNYHPPDNRIEIRFAQYHDQLRTHFLLDLPFTSIPVETALSSVIDAENLREYDAGSDVLSGECRLASFPSSVLPNTIGIATLLMTADRFLILPRRHTKMMAFGGMLGCSASGALEWSPRFDSRGRGDGIGTYLIEDVTREIDEELGLPSSRLKTVPLAFCRELYRGGKPQYFYATFYDGELGQAVESIWNSKAYREYACIYAVNLVGNGLSQIASALLQWNSNDIQLSEELKVNLYYLAVLLSLE